MNRKILIILTLCFIAAFPSCKKAPLTVGPIVTQTRELPNFTEVYLNDNINLSLVRSDTCYIEITTGKNIIDNITTDVSHGNLTIRNTTICNWIRPFDYRLEATLFYKDIKNFEFASSGTLTTKNVYNGDLNEGGYYRFMVDGGSGDIDLNISNCKDLRIVYQYGTSHLDIHGENNNNLAIYKRSYGVIDARNYHAKIVDVTSISPSDCYINATELIDATINDLGDIYYLGEPDSISERYGQFARGHLIHL